LPNLLADKTAIPGLEIGAWCSLGYVAQAIGLSLTSPAKGAFICALFMVITPLCNGLQGRKVALQAWLAVAVALFGTACLEGLVPGMDVLIGSGAVQPDGLNAGDVWCFGTAIGFGAMFSRMEAHMDRLSDDEAALPLTAWQLVCLVVAMAGWRAFDVVGAGGVAVSPADYVDHLQLLNGAESLLLPSIVWMGLISGAAVLWGETVVLKDVPSTEAGVIFATEPVWAAGSAALILHESISANEFIGGAAIVIACLCLQIPEEVLLSMAGQKAAVEATDA